MSASPILPNDPRYAAVVDKRFNKRFRATPDYVCIAESTADIIEAVDRAVRDGKRLAVTSGGHCLENFASDAELGVIIDVAPMKRVYLDPATRAIAIEAGVTVGEAFRALHDEWGVVVPLGEYPGIGIGGHVVGGAFGFLCRQLGLAADYLHAVEVVTVGDDRRARCVIATRDADDPNRELWWAHTGGGGGNFGIVTRYWFRAPDATGDDPGLPRAPQSIATWTATWRWADLDGDGFRRLLANHGRWSELHSAPDDPETSLWTLLQLPRVGIGDIMVRGVSTAGHDSDAQMDAYLTALSDGVIAPAERSLTKHSWLGFALDPFPDLFGGPAEASVKVKDAMLRRRLTDRQIDVVHHYLTRDEPTFVGGMFGLATYGGRVNAVAPDDAASAQRGTIFDCACNVGWMDPQAGDAHLSWAREFYRELFADTGGVPVPGDAYDGAFINHPDTDLADPSFNMSGVPWSTLYYRDNYPRLQRAKAKWDPHDIFRHALSIRGAR